MQEPRPHSHSRKHHIYRKPSSNTSIESNEPVHVVKKKFCIERKNTNNILLDEKQNIQDHCLSRRLNICNGQKLSYEVIKRDSKQKRAEFLEKYAHDPFMRKKFEKSVEKFNRSKSKQVIEKQMKEVYNPPSVKVPSTTYTTFRQQIKRQSQQTVKLINNCKMLVEELKKNRLAQAQNQEQFKQKTQIPSRHKFTPKRYEPGHLTERV